MFPGELVVTTSVSLASSYKKECTIRFNSLGIARTGISSVSLAYPFSSKKRTRREAMFPGELVLTTSDSLSYSVSVAWGGGGGGLLFVNFS